MTDPLADLSDEERWAAGAVARATGATPEAHDVGGRQGAVDVTLAYPDGKTGALEVTSHAAEGVRQRDAILGRQGYTWPNPGAWSWFIQFGPQAQITELWHRYKRLIALCEQGGATRPDLLPWELQRADLDLRWLGENDVTMRGTPIDGRQPSDVAVLPQSFGGFVDEQLAGLPAAVEDLLQVEMVARRVAKLVAHKADEHHLFVLIREGGLPGPQYMALVADADALPAFSPSMPIGLSHLWLSTGYGPRLLCCSPGGWSDHRVFDVPR